MVKNYELTYTVSNNLTPEEETSLYQKVLSYFPNAIQKSAGHDFFTLEFSAEPEMLKDLESKIKSETQIKKHIIVKKEAIKLVKIRTRKPLPKILNNESEQKVEKVEIKEIDKKLKEIFGE
ncbi:MAG: hypothetical protein HYV47_04210 [Candidatus Nealsonbacteria bacterium]|nr:hypothetical protein [Candidatus Nealsonbacteria bacterium]